MGMDFGCDQLSSGTVWDGGDGGGRVLEWLLLTGPAFLLFCSRPELSYWAGIAPESYAHSMFCTVLARGYMTCGWRGVFRPVFRKLSSSN